jgi:protein-tyrosine phosphatase
MCTSAAEIVPHLWLGNIKASRNATFLHDNEISCIVNCTKNYDFDQTAMIPGTKKIRIAISDTGTDEARQAFLELADRVSTAIYQRLVKGDHLLVHCYAGKQRSPAIILAFLIKYCDYNVDEALKAVNTRMKSHWKIEADHYIEALEKYRADLKS